jgi:MSHA biogenesis protein MshM
MGPDDLLLALASELGVEVSQSPHRHEIMNGIGACLLGHARAHRRVVVCIDEAQAIPVRTVESLRLLSNLETEKRKLLQIVLLGQPDLDDKLARPEIRQLLQRITFSEFLGPMDLRRVPVYLQHRLATAAVDDTVDARIFSPEAAAIIATASGGVPRLINVLAHKCLMLAYGEDKMTVTADHVRMAVRDTEGVPKLAPWWRRWAGPLLRRRQALQSAKGNAL